jgi:hypothetical protein
LDRLRTYIIGIQKSVDQGKSAPIASPKGKRPLETSDGEADAAGKGAPARSAATKPDDSESSDDDFGPSAPVVKKKRGGLANN